MHAIRLAFCLALCLSAAAAQAADLTVRVDDVKSAQGKIMVAVYDAANFLKRPVQSAQVAAAAGSVKLVIKDLPPGDYGVALYHDANGNGKMDRNGMGIPLEDYAFSNNALGSMGPPAFEQVKFSVPADGATSTISLR